MKVWPRMKAAYGAGSITVTKFRSGKPFKVEVIEPENALLAAPSRQPKVKASQ